MKIIYGANYGRPTLDLNFARNKSLIDTISGQNLVTFSRSQTGREATYVGSDGLIKYASANEPRFDHNPFTGECLGLLVEESRSNSIRDSSNYNFTNWHYAYCQLTTNATTAPDGTNTAGLVRQTNGTSTRQFMCTSYSIPSTGSSWTASVYVKRYNYDHVIFTAGDEDSGNRGDRFGYLQGQLGFNFATKQIIMNPSTNWGGNITGFGYEELPDGWFRIWFSKASFPRANYWGISVQQPTVNGNTGINNDLPSVVGNGISGVYVWGFQWESGPFYTSHIPTGSSAVTRAADQASITGTNFSRWYNQSEGTWFADVHNPGKVASSRIINTGVNLWSGPTNAGYVRTGSSSVLLTTSYPAKVSAKYSSSSLTGAVNGTLMAEAGGTNITATYVDIGSANTAAPGVGFINNPISRLTYYPTRLQDYQLQQLTK